MRPTAFVLPRLQETRRLSMRLWSSDELGRLRELAGNGIEISAIAMELRRSVAAIRNKAAMHGISLTRARAESGE